MKGEVTAVVCAAFDAATDEQIHAVREVVRAHGVAVPDRPTHRPHLTLSAARVPVGGVDAVVEVAAEVAARHAPVAVVLAEVGMFGRAGVLWLGPSPHPALDALQRDVHDSLVRAGFPAAFGERSTPPRWVAHCTLARRIPPAALRRVHRAVVEKYVPISATVEALATILVGGRGDVAHVPLSGG